MSASFEPIKIVDLATEKTEQSPTASGLRLMYLKLSRAAPVEWQQLFENQRQFPRHSMWRKATAYGSYIIVDCAPEEMEKYHLRDLKEDVSVVNAKYLEYLERKTAAEKREAELKAAEKQRLEGIRTRLDFS